MRRMGETMRRRTGETTRRKEGKTTRKRGEMTNRRRRDDTTSRVAGGSAHFISFSSFMYLGTTPREKSSLGNKYICDLNLHVRFPCCETHKIKRANEHMSSSIHPCPPLWSYRKGWNSCKYIVPTTMYNFSLENRAQQA